MSHIAARLIAQSWINAHSLPRLLATARCECDYVAMSPTKVVEGTTPPKLTIVARPQIPMSQYGIVWTSETAARALATAESRLLMKQVSLHEPQPVTSLNDVKRSGVIVISHHMRHIFATYPGFTYLDNGLVFGALGNTPVLTDKSQDEHTFMDKNQIAVFEPYSVHFNPSEIHGELPALTAPDESSWAFAIELTLGVDSRRIHNYTLS